MQNLRAGRRWLALALIGANATACTGADEGAPAGPADGIDRSDASVDGPHGGADAASPAGDGASAGPDGSDAGSDVPNVACGIPEVTRFARLTHVQYDNTVADLLGLDVRPSSMLPPESTGNMDERLSEGYRVAAAALATQLANTEGALGRLLPCTPDADEGACARESVVVLARRAFRRPPADDEVERYLGLFTARGELTQSGSFAEGMLLVIEALLQAPSFIMRVEHSVARDGAHTVLDGYDMASRLSYMLWNSMPDQALLDAAEAGELTTSAQLRAQAERMLAAPRARGMVAAFHRSYLKIDGSQGGMWTDVVRDPERYPEWRPELAPLLAQETLQVIEQVMFGQQGGFHQLLKTGTAFVNRDTAPFYGLDASDYGADLEAVELEADERPGIFTRLGFLASHAMFDRTSPILRGAFLQKEVLCLELPSPPAGAPSTPLPSDPNLVTTRQKVEVQTAETSCSACHRSIINPVGFALEHFDAIGRLRATDNGAPVDAAGIASIGGDLVSVSGASSLMDAIAAAPAARRCYAKRLVEYAYARSSTEDRCMVDDLAQKLAREDYSLLELLVDLTQADSFRLRASEAEVAP